MNNREYSEAEAKLIKACGYSHLLELAKSCDMPTIYRICVVDGFINNHQGPQYDALRRAYKAIEECNPYRMTAEFDELIKF